MEPQPSVPEPAPSSPVRVRGDLDPNLSRWQWLVKWLLAIPHFVVLIVLGIGWVLATVVAFFAILFTGRYPRPLFDYSVGVMRWGWRVAFYALSPLGTDRYPPFSLNSDPGYPADLEVDYPEQLSRGLVLVKWWLLAIPHYLIVGAVLSTAARMGSDGHSAGGLSLLGALSIVAGVALLFTAVYPRGLFDFAMGLNRWIVRVHVYAGLLRDDYPPFRLDQGPREP
ncbi:DUF4389 domain-containing protein [Nocardia stercoris]|uniref:DUF4389 domain-containing protein n=1 Tax=Nocardia stercoris TaxID=2483361 RepID=A0A3M2L0N4_9NOCA|nr:DUF4389 domain-containing protein [Nocardia stercoris]RMI30053.1 DUF4389 domain-containing protein [Nocardia stercoris]